MSGRGGVTVDILVQSPLWERMPAAETTVQRAISAAAGHPSISQLSTSEGEVAIVLTDDSAIQALNRDWRGADKPTNVLSFPAAKTDVAGAPAMLGDIVIAYETVARESTDEGKDIQHHLAHLAVHGFLHLLGYDHDDDRNADDMERLESDILAGLGIPDPYFARDLDRA
ncbi:MAG: rRNA maturation RNase YbeY [Pseudolabrys sp.]